MKEAIIIFTRVPIEGKTKTRLEGFLTRAECKNIHINFLKDIKETCESTKRDIFIFYTPKDYEGILKNILGDLGEYHVQIGNDLGEKMFNALNLVLKIGYDSCILIGTDIPEIKRDYLEDSFNALKSRDIVIGPTVDKGYYLIGMKKGYKWIFENQIYGSGSVFLNTLSKIDQQKLTYYIAETCLDIDDKEDLLILYKKIKDKKVINCRYTIEFLEHIMEVKFCTE